MHILKSSKAVVDGVLNGEYQTGICVTPLPGRQADKDLFHGFCSDVALAAKYAIENHDLERLVRLLKIFTNFFSHYFCAILFLQYFDCRLGYQSRQ